MASVLFVRTIRDLIFVPCGDRRPDTANLLHVWEDNYFTGTPYEVGGGEPCQYLLPLLAQYFLRFLACGKHLSREHLLAAGFRCDLAVPYVSSVTFICIWYSINGVLQSNVTSCR